MIEIDIRDFVPKEVYAAIGDSSINLITPFLLTTYMELNSVLSNHYNSPVEIVINNWHKDGKLQFRGYRPDSCPIGAKFSQHKKGNAIDFNVCVDGQLKSDEEIRKIIIANCKEFTFLTRIESGTVGWVHVDCFSAQNRKKGDAFIIFKP
jgi:hypothetical protein